MLQTKKVFLDSELDDENDHGIFDVTYNDDLEIVSVTKDSKEFISNVQNVKLLEKTLIRFLISGV